MSSYPDSDKLRIKKFVNNRWATRHRDQKYYKRPTGTSHCLQCKLHSETEDHILRCRIPTRQKIRDKWRTEFLKYLSETHTPKAIRDALCHGFFNWLESGRNTQDIPPLPTRDKDVLTAYDHQTTLGWQHFARGRMTIEWGNIINQHLETKPQHSFNAEHWGAKLVAIHWKHILELWSVRNSEVHGDTLEQTEQVHRTTMIDEIVEIQNAHQHLPASALELISRDKAALQEMSTSSITSYLYGAKMLDESVKKHQNDQDTVPISTFFQPRQRKLNKKDAQI
jgi:hypothetical protein